MTLDVEKLAREVLQELDSHYGDPAFVGYGGTVKELENFARLVLEEAAKACESKHANGNHKHDTREECAEAIRALLPEQE